MRRFEDDLRRLSSTDQGTVAASSADPVDGRSRKRRDIGIEPNECLTFSRPPLHPCASELESVILTIVNKRGLHARASAKFVQAAERFDADISVSRDGMTVDGQSIMGLMMLAASQGTTIEVTASGAQAHEALAAIEALVANRFGEED